MTLIETTKGFIFGGFTPVSWDSSGTHKADSIRKSFLFTLKNARNIEARRFMITNTSFSICCNPFYGPNFGGNNEISVCDSCDTSTNNSTGLGTYYLNDTGIDGTQVFTGEEYFTVKEIEVFHIIFSIDVTLFHITDFPDLPPLSPLFAAR